MAAQFEARSSAYREKYGTVPRFRAGLHFGSVMTGEMGSLKKEIAFVGDTVNTTARVEDACRQLDQWAIITRPLLRQVTLPEGVDALPLGEIELRGRKEPLLLYALSKAQNQATEQHNPRAETDTAAEGTIKSSPHP